jgi:hypothetical protein
MINNSERLGWHGTGWNGMGKGYEQQSPMPPTSVGDSLNAWMSDDHDMGV